MQCLSDTLSGWQGAAVVPGPSAAAQPLGSCRSPVGCRLPGHQPPIPPHAGCVQAMGHHSSLACATREAAAWESHGRASASEEASPGGWERGDPLSISQTNQGGCTSLPKALTALCPSEPGHGPALPSARSGSKPHACLHPPSSPPSPLPAHACLWENPALFPRAPHPSPPAQAPARQCLAAPMLH